MRYLLLLLTVLWLAVSGVFFYLRFAGSGMLPLSFPILTLALAVLCFAAFLLLGRTMGKRKRK